MSNSLVSFTKGALASRIVVGYRGTGSSPSLTPFEDAVDIRYCPAQHGHLPDRSNLPLPGSAANPWNALSLIIPASSATEDPRFKGNVLVGRARRAVELSHYGEALGAALVDGDLQKA
jgi:hypothetical protein